jgi:tRNA dimethylallyltransferase
MNHLIAIVGPTAVGKSELVLEPAIKNDGEIINSDSRQIYRYMDIGTAKPSKSDREIIPHHLYDIANPDEHYSLAVYQKSVYQIIKDVLDRSRLPFLVGGTGLYTWAVLEGWEIPSVTPDPSFRQELEKKAEEQGWQCLYDELKQIDPVSADNIVPKNMRRVIRALEISRYSGTPASQLRNKKGVFFDFTVIGLTMERKKLYERIDKRVDRMIASGLIDEVKRLLDMGYEPELPSMSGIGYRQIASYINGKIELDDAVIQIKNGTHRLARKQYAWFKLSDSRIHWFDVDANIKDNIYTLIAEANGL